MALWSVFLFMSPDSFDSQLADTPAPLGVEENRARPGAIPENVSADVVHIEYGGAQSVEANIITINQGGAQTARAEHIDVESGVIGQASADDISVAMGGIGIVQARRIDINDSQVGVLSADVVDAGNVKTGVLFAHKVNGDVQTVLSQKTAAILGLTAGLTLGIFMLLFRPRR